MPELWSPVHISHERVSKALFMTRAAVWRRRVGFIEASSSSEGLWASVEQTSHIVRWLASEGAGVTLRLVFKVGGAQRSVAWVGLAADSATERDARQRLAGPAEALGEALDAWGLFSEVPQAGPRYPARGRAVLIQPGSLGGGGELSPGGAVVEALGPLSRRRTPMSLCMDLRGGQSSSKLLRDLRQINEDTRQRVSRMSFSDYLDGSADETLSLHRATEELMDQALGCEVSIRVHGPAPGAILARQLLVALGSDLDREVSLSPVSGPPNPQGELATVAGLLRSLWAGAEASTDQKPARPASLPDGIPF